MFKKPVFVFIAACLIPAFAPTLILADGVGTVGPSSFPARSGEKIYQTVCQSCHMADAKGATGAASYPVLAGDINLVSSAFTAYTIIYGRKAMPGFGGMLDDEQVANVVNYLRQNFGNSYQDTLTPDDISKLRKPGYEYPDLN